MSSKTKRLKIALKRVFKVRGSGRAHTKHVALVDSPGAATTDSEQENTSTPLPSTHGIPNLDLLIGQKTGPADIDEMTIFSDKTGFSIKTEAPNDEKAGAASNGWQTFAGISNIPPSPSKPLFKRSRSTSFAQNDKSMHTRRLSGDLSTVHSNEEKLSIKSSEQEQMRESPTGVTDLFPLPGRDISPGMPPSASNPEVSDQNRNRSRSGSGETAASRQSKCVVPRSHDAQKTNEAFLALKKELEKNEFTKAAQVIKQVQSQEGSIITAAASVDSTGKPRQKKLPGQQHTDTYEIIPASPSAESNPASIHTEMFDNILGITQVSQSESLDSLCSDGSSYSSFDMESIGEITIDSTTLKLIEMHKIYCDNARVNHNHPARVKKSNMRVASAYSPIEMTKSDSSVKTEMNRRLTWYDEGENLNKPFTLKTDETFEDSTSLSSSKQSFEGIHKGLKMIDQFLIPFTRHGLEKILGGLNCGGE
jgi:hypothetical protein